MALSIKLSAMRPFALCAFNRQSCNLLATASSSGPIIAPSGRSYSNINTNHHHHQNTTTYGNGGHMRVLARPISSQNIDNNKISAKLQDSSVINNNINTDGHSCLEQATLLAKSRDGESDSSSDDSSRPTEEQLQSIADRMGAQIPTFFRLPHDFRLYHKNVVFEDNIRNVRTVGLNGYAWQLAWVKMGAHFKYGKVSMSALKITKHTEDGTVRIRWRIETFPGNSIVFAFWQFKMWNTKESLDAHKDEWIDGFSIFHVGGDGLIYKHVCDKVIPDTNKAEPKKSNNLAMKLGIALGLIPSGEHFADDLLSKIYEILSNF